jgi:hypothetical protein
MGCLVTRHGLHRHAYVSPDQPARVELHATSAIVQNPHSGATTMYPVSSPLTGFASDGAPFYNSGYLAGYPSAALPGGLVNLQLPPRAAMLDLTDTQSWDRPVFWPGSQ